jgi:demethylmenaquinone methyltransferase/2-methoxy-6-polyprenyl-1,4-benzoquinol methylase
MAELLSLGQDLRWRRFLASRVNAIPGSWVLDAATGTAKVAIEVAGRRNARVAALDQSVPMLLRGRRNLSAARLENRVFLVVGRAESLPFPDGAFDSVTFTYLLRYVEDPSATVAELARVARPGGVMAGLEFHVPESRFWHATWFLHTRLLMPAMGWAVSPAWFRACRFLGPSISRFYRHHPLAEQVGWWQGAGIQRVRTRRMSLGGGVVIWGIKGRG